MLGALLRNRESLLGMEDSTQNWHLPQHTRFSPAWIPGGSLRDQFHKYPSHSHRAQGRAGHGLRHRAFLAGWAFTVPDASDSKCKVCSQSHGPAEAGAPCRDRLPLRKEDAE